MTGEWRRDLCMSLAWWASAWTLPLLLPQAWQARRQTPRLPEAPLPWDGVTGGSGPELRVLVAGESPAAGVGAGDQRAGIAGQTAACLGELLARRVCWWALGRNGATVSDLRAEILARTSTLAPDIVLLLFGVNDTTSLTPRPRWRREISSLDSALRAAGAGAVAISQLPPVHLFTALPQPLRSLVGLRARLLDADLKRLAARGLGPDYLSVRFEPRPEYLAEDGYHPSAAGCRLWGQAMARGLASILGAEGGPVSPARAARAG